MCKDHHAVYEVSKARYKLAVVALLEVRPGEVVVLSLWHRSSEHVAKYVLLTWEIL